MVPEWSMSMESKRYFSWMWAFLELMMLVDGIEGGFCFLAACRTPSSFRSSGLLCGRAKWNTCKDSQQEQSELHATKLSRQVMYKPRNRERRPPGLEERSETLKMRRQIAPEIEQRGGWVRNLEEWMSCGTKNEVMPNTNVNYETAINASFLREYRIKRRAKDSPTQ